MDKQKTLKAFCLVFYSFVGVAEVDLVDELFDQVFVEVSTKVER